MADIRQSSVIQDDFNRVENPLTGVPPGSWTAMHPGTRGPLADDGASAGTNASDNPGGGIWYSVWMSDVIPAGDVEVWGGPMGGQAGAALAGWRLGFVTESSSPGAFDGYLFLREDALGQFTYWRKYSGGSIALDTQGTTFSNTTGALLMARKIGTTLEAWSCSTSDGSGTWTLLNQWTGENSYTGPWRLFLGVEDPTIAGTGWDFFGGSIMTDWPQEFIRRPHNYMGRTITRQNI